MTVKALLFNKVKRASRVSRFSKIFAKRSPPETSRVKWTCKHVRSTRRSRKKDKGKIVFTFVPVFY